MTTVDAAESLIDPEPAMRQSDGADEGHPYRDILKSSALIGASTAINIVFGIVRTKALAVILGPAGYGVYGGFSVVADLAKNVAQFGINSSGVRQVAAASASGDRADLSRTVRVLRIAAVVSALVGALAMCLVAGPVSRLTFGNDHYTGSMALLAIAVLLGVLASGEIALLQGLRRIADLARINVFGAFLGTAASIPLVFLFGERGIVPSLAIVAGASTLLAWRYGTRVPVEPAPLTLRQTVAESSQLFRLGFVFMCSSLLTLGAAYVVRVILLRSLGPEAAGLYQAAWTLGGLYIGFVLQAMGTDFYPKLVVAAADNAQCNRLVNEQARVSLLLSIPGVMGTLTLAPLVIDLFYARTFGGATEVLRWVCLGMALRVLTWPLGYIAVAKNRQRLFFATDLLWTIANVALTWVCVARWGTAGAGMAFFGSYIFHWTMVYPIARHLSGFRWSRSNALLTAAFLSLMAIVFVSNYVLPPAVATAGGLVVTAASVYLCARALVRYAAPERVPAVVRRLLNIRGPQ